MARAKKHYFVLDHLNKERGELLKKSLLALPEISGTKYDLQMGIIEVEATIDPEAQVKLACDVAGTTFRTRVKKGQI